MDKEQEAAGQGLHTRCGLRGYIPNYIQAGARDVTLSQVPGCLA